MSGVRIPALLFHNPLRRKGLCPSPPGSAKAGIGNRTKNRTYSPQFFGDLVADAITFFAAFLALGAALALVIYARGRFAPAAIIGYWTIVLVERAAGTPLGDWLDSRHRLGLGLPIASTITTALLLATLEWRRRATSARP